MSGTRSRPDRAVSPVVGYALILLIAMLGATAVVLIGSGAISAVESSAQAGQAESTMTLLDSKAATVVLGESDAQQLSFGRTGSGTVTVEENVGRIEIRAVNDTGTRVIVNESLGAVVYETGDETVAYQGGGVWREYESGTRMISPPEFHYRDQTLTFPIIRVTGGDLARSSTGDVTLQNSGSEQLFPNETMANPLANGHVQVKVTSKYHRGWSAYFTSRTDGAVRHFPSNQTVLVNLTVPFTESFDYAVATTEEGDDAITATGNSEFDTPQLTGANRPSASPMVDQWISTCESGGCEDLTSALSDDTLENDTYYHDGDVTLGPTQTTYDTSAGDIQVVVDGDVTFKGSGGPGTTDHVITGDGMVTFYVKGDVEISGNAAVNTGGDPSDLLVMVHSDAGEVAAASGTPQFTGLVYAPNSHFVINGGGACGVGGGPPDDAGPPDDGDDDDDGGGGSCDGNVVGAIVVQDATAHGNGKLKYGGTVAIGLEFDEVTEITYLHVTENRIEVTDN